MILLKNINALIYGNDASEVVKADIYLKDDKIFRIDTLEEGNIAKPELKADYVIDGTDRLVIPGLINSHTHAYMSLLRNLADDVPFTTWLFDTISPLEDVMTGEEAYYGTLLANMEMLRSGTTTYIDMHMHRDFAARAPFESGMRVCLTRGLVGNEADDEGGIRRLGDCLNDRDAWCDGDLRTVMLAPHAPYTCGPDFLKFVAEKARELNLGIHIHLAEGADEIKGLREKYNLTPIEYADRAGVFESRTIAAHCVHLTDSDIDLLAAKHVNVATNPVSNMKLANGFSPIPRLIDAGINVTIGTDGAASNNSLNLFREMSVEALIHKGLERDAVTVSAEQVLKMATINGAAALGRGDELGSIAEGKKADLSIINLRTPALMPNNNLISSLIYSANGSEVETVIVNGQILMEKNEFRTIDSERVYFEIEKIGRKYRSLVKR